MKVIYIAGPFRAANHWEVERNVRRAEALALEVWKSGAAAVCPHANTRFFSGVLPDQVWLDGDLEILERCDAVLTMGAWRNSIGTCAEVARAELLGKPVLHTLACLHLWLENPYAKLPDAIDWGFIKTDDNEEPVKRIYMSDIRTEYFGPSC